MSPVSERSQNPQNTSLKRGVNDSHPMRYAPRPHPNLSQRERAQEIKEGRACLCARPSDSVTNRIRIQPLRLRTLVTLNLS